MNNIDNNAYVPLFRQGELKRILPFLFSYDKSIEEWDKLEGWELQFSEERVRSAKKTFLDKGPTMVDLARWKVGMFDSVSSHFVIGRLVVPNTFVGGIPGTSPFGVSLSQQQEMSVGQGRPSCKDYIATMGADVSVHMVAWRNKIDGTPMETLGGSLRCCFWYMPTSEMILAELTSEGAYQLWPYGPPLTVSGFEFLPHPWHSFPVRDRMIEEGIMLLGRDGVEYRSKRYATVELEGFTPLHSGVWEYEYKYGSLHPIRPRSGKGRNNFSYLSKVLVYSELTFPTRSDPIVMKLDGPVEEVVTCEEGVVRIDSGRRSSKIIAVNSDVVTVQSGSTRMIYPAVIPYVGHSIVGSKAVVYCGSVPYVFKDKCKKYDLVGGKIEFGESSRAALFREWGEEVGTPLDVDPVYLGISCDSPFFTFVYSVTLDAVPSGFVPASSTLEYVPWCLRLLSFAAMSRVSPCGVVSHSSDILELSPHGHTLAREWKSSLPYRAIHMVAGKLEPLDYHLWHRVWGYCFVLIMALDDSPIRYVDLLTLNHAFARRKLVSLSFHQILSLFPFVGSAISSAMSSDYVSTIVVRRAQSKSFFKGSDEFWLFVKRHRLDDIRGDET